MPPSVVNQHTEMRQFLFKFNVIRCRYIYKSVILVNRKLTATWLWPPTLGGLQFLHHHGWDVSHKYRAEHNGRLVRCDSDALVRDTEQRVEVACPVNLPSTHTAIESSRHILPVLAVLIHIQQLVYERNNKLRYHSRICLNFSYKWSDLLKRGQCHLVVQFFIISPIFLWHGNLHTTPTCRLVCIHAHLRLISSTEQLQFRWVDDLFRRPTRAIWDSKSMTSLMACSAAILSQPRFSQIVTIYCQ